MAGGGVGEASLVFGGWQPRGQPESFRSVEAHLGLGRFTLISIQEQKVPAWCSPARPLDALTVLGLSRGSQLEIQLPCVCPSSAYSPSSFTGTLSTFLPPPPQPDSISLSNCCLFSGTQPWGHSLRHPAGLTAKGKKEGNGMVAGSKKSRLSALTLSPQH